MPKHVALLRGINVAGNTRIGMSELRNLFIDLGHTEVATYLQSGNVAFKAADRDSRQIVAEIEKQVVATFGINVAVLLRTREDFAKLHTANPYLDIESDPTKLHVTFLEQEPQLDKVNSLEMNSLGVPAGETGRFAVVKREVYLHCPDGYGRTKLNNRFFERRLGVRATTRNWKSVAALYAMVSG